MRRNEWRRRGLKGHHASSQFNKQTEEEKQGVVMQAFHDTISPLRHAVLGF